MASTRELWILLRARDEASRVVHSFSKNVRAAALSAQAAQKSAEAAAFRQQAQMLKSNSATAQNIRAINDQVIALEKQARSQTAAAAKAREYRAEQMKAIDATVRGNNRTASSLERQAKAYTLAAAVGEEQRNNIIRVTGATEEEIKKIDDSNAAIRRRAATLNAEAGLLRSHSASLIAGLQEEQTGLDGSIRSYERRAAAIRAQAAILRNSAQAQNVTLQNQIRILTDQAGALDRQANSLRQAANRAREHDIAMRHLRESLGKVSEGATVAAFSLAAVGAGGLVGLKRAIDTTVEYDRQVRATMTQTGNFKTSLQELGDIGKRVANEVAVPFEQIQPALFDVFSSMDVGVKDAEKLLKAFSKAAVAGQTDIQAVSRATVGILNAFHRPASDVNKILDIQFQLVKLGIGTYEEWNQRIGLVTPSAVRAGQSIEMMAAALATSTRMGISAARSGTAVSRAMDAISHPAAVKNMEQLGIKVRDAHGKFRPMNKILREFREELLKMPEKDRVAAILDVFKGAGGTIEARRFLQNILLGKGNLEAFDSVLKRVQNSSGTMEGAYKTMADSTAAKSELLRNKWELLKTAIGEALIPKFNSLIDTMSHALDWFNRLPEGTKNTITQFLLWGSVISIVLAGLFGFIAVAAVVAAAIGTIGIAATVAIVAIGLLPVAIVALGAAFIAAYKNSEDFRNAVKQAGDNIKQLWQIAVSTAKGIKDSWDQNVGPPLQKISGIVKDTLLPAFREFVAMYENEVIPKVKEAGRVIQDLADGAFKRIGEVIDGTVVPAVERMSEWWKKHGDELRPLLTILGQVMKWFLIIAAVITGVVVVALVGPLVAAVALVVGAFQLLAMGAAAALNFFKSIPGFFASVGSAIAGFAGQVGGFFAGLWNTIVTFFTGVFDWFGQLPGRIMGFITGLPAMLGDLFRNALNIAAYAIGYGLGLIYVFFTQIVPKVMGFLATLPARLAALFVGALAAAGRAVMSGITAIHNFFLSLPGKAASAVSRLWSSIQGHFNKARTGATNAGRDLVAGVMKFLNEFPSRAATAIYNVYTAILHGFDGAANWLIGAGEDIIRGVINGIGNMIGGAVDAARNAAHSMVKGFRDAIKSKSPSKVFRDIGYDIIRGLINGVTGSRKSLDNAMSRLAHDVMASLNAGKASKALKKSWSTKLASVGKQLLGLEAKRASVITKIATAQKSLNDQVKVRAELYNSIRDKLSEGADLTTLKGDSVAELKDNLAARLQALRDFQRNLQTLANKGLSKESISELAQAGVDSTGALVQTLASASQGDIQKINQMQDDIRKAAGSTANNIAGQMYDAGIQAAQGLIKGLQSQQAAITKQMQSIANSLIKSIKRALGIKSPSRVFMDIGKNTALGYIQGYANQMRNANNNMHGEILNMGAGRSSSTFSGNSANGTTESRPATEQNFTIYTQEIDPRRHAAQLGWELESRG